MQPSMEVDYYQWLLSVAERIRQGRFEEINREELAEELESMGRRERQELVNRFIVLIGHLLKWQFRVEQRSSSWRGTIFEQQRQILRELKLSPSLKPYLSTAIEAYPEAAELAARETSIPIKSLPEKCYYSLQQLLNYEFFPS